jgi:hypothetical protein
MSVVVPHERRAAAKIEISEPQEKVMRNPEYVKRAKLNPAHTFKSPMDVVETNYIEPAEKLAILKAWESDERALMRAEDEGMGGGEHAHLHKVHAALGHLRRSNAEFAIGSRCPQPEHSTSHSRRTAGR